MSRRSQKILKIYTTICRGFIDLEDVDDKRREHELAKQVDFIIDRKRNDAWDFRHPNRWGFVHRGKNSPCDNREANQTHKRVRQDVRRHIERELAAA